MKFTKIDDNHYNTKINSSIDNKSVDIQEDKYLYNRIKTIGLRNDRKLSKFVGIRDGYSKQLEFTIDSIIIDDVEKIASNRVNFSDINIDDNNNVIHKINDIEIYNTVDLTYYKNLIKINETFNNIEIYYIIDLKGVKINNYSYIDGDKKIYRQNCDGSYNISDIGNDNVLFKIENPLAFDEDNGAYNILFHELYELDDIIYYKKYIKNNIIEKLPIFIDINVSFNLSTKSNIQSHVTNANDTSVWENALSGNSTLSLNSNNNSNNKHSYICNSIIDEWENYYYNGIIIDNNDGNLWVYNLGEYSAIFSNTIECKGGDIIIIQLNITSNSYYPTIFINEYDDSRNLLETTKFISDYNNSTYSNELITNINTTTVDVTIGNNNDGEIGQLYMLYNIYIKGTPNIKNYYDAIINRSLLFFDIGNIYKEVITNISFNINLDTPNYNNYVIQNAITNNDNYIVIGDWDSFDGEPYNTFYANVVTQKIDLGQDIIDNYIKGEPIKLMIREQDTDYDGYIPDISYDESLIHNWSYELSVDVNTILLTDVITFDIDLDVNGFGVIQSVDSDFIQAQQGFSSTVIHSSVSSTYISGITYDYDGVNDYVIRRTFLNFDTSKINIYNKCIVSRVTLKVMNYNDVSDISIFKGLQDTQTPLDSNSFNEVGGLLGVISGATSNSHISIDLDTSIITDDSSLLFDYSYVSVVLIDTLNDIGNDSSEASSNFGIDFSYTKLEIELTPYTISGLEYIKVEYGKMFNLTASVNTLEGNIRWSNNSDMSDYFNSGNNIMVNSYLYDISNTNDFIIYAAILDDSNNIISNNILTINLEFFVYEGSISLERPLDKHVVDIDAVYFKQHQCISGATYSYVRDLNDIYEQSVEVCDSDGTGSYNLYNQFDIIDEFYSNVSDVEVVAKLDEIDLTISQKIINDVHINEGTRVLLYSTFPTENDGIYVANYNLLLVKTDELNDSDKGFRYKVNINAGKYFDYEFHTKYINSDDIIINYLDTQIYGDDVIDMSDYSDIYIDSNIT